MEEKDDDSDENKKSVWWFLNKSLQLHNAPVIDSLCMELGPRCPIDADIGKWVAKAVDLLVHKLNFKLLWSAEPTRLPKSLYSCQTLVDLTLSHQILVDVPLSACLPSLRELDLDCVVYKNEDSLVRLFSSCPVLEILNVTRANDDNVKKFTVKVPSLWDLWYSNSLSGEDDGYLVVDAPAMTTLHIFDVSGDSCSIEDMPFLEDANIDIESYPDDKFLTSLSSVLAIRLFLSDTMVMRCGNINLSRLVKLRICPSRPDWLTPLVHLLGNAPQLKEFLVDSQYTYEPEDLSFSWNQPSPVPKCLPSELEILEWRDYGDRVEEKEFLTYILANSKRLKTVTISLRSTIDLEEQKLIMEELKDIPRVSTASHLLFNW
ncbi:unnamed protein product [Microthlaspi erraticum]|uniref:FBD domain-containing protein n=1 Tax=Microthlaspi erraticum TaxID=1685480 RepID=A0A6D2IVT4_9BRAS|nr:unnamed protein product [Microthlaspi erraticum]